MVSEKLSNRILSIDVFRGLTIFTMIFVNDLASVKGIPSWMEHMPANADGMTFVDVVFPAFLFIVGMSLPFALNKRLKQTGSFVQVWKHVLSRSASLLILGIMMVNISGLNEAATGMSKHLWMLLVFIGAILTWNSYPKGSGNKKILYSFLKSAGILLLVILAIIYRSGSSENLSWFQTKWWGILGLIGWAYLGSSSIYLLFRNYKAAIVGSFALLIILYIGDKNGALKFLGSINDVIWLGGHFGAHTAIALAGVLTGMLFTHDSKITDYKKRLLWIISFATMLFLGGYLLRPLYGISKIYATPSWSLYSAGYCAISYALIYWLIDVKKLNKWANFLKPAGANPLLAYLLPDIFYALISIFGITILSKYFGEGIIGIFRSLIFSLLMVWFTNILSKLNIKLHL